MILRVDVKPELLRWARERAGIEPDVLVKRFPKYREWESGQKQPTLKQLEKLAKVTRAPIGSFFLSQPLEERVPIPDLRIVGDRPIGCSSVDLLDTVYLCQQRQDWYRDFALIEGQNPLPFAGSATPASAVESTAESMRSALGFNLDERHALPTWTEALRRLIEQADALGVLVMTSGIVGNNTRRKLDPEEFRGFALADDLAPLIFINGRDSKAAQMFTIAHELATSGWASLPSRTSSRSRHRPTPSRSGATVPRQSFLSRWLRCARNFERLRILPTRSTGWPAVTR